MAESILDDPSFYSSLLRLGRIPNEEKIHPRLLGAMASLLRANIDASVSPTDCAGAAALVVLAYQMAGDLFFQRECAPHSSPKAEKHQRTGSTLLEIRVEVHPHEK